jgi:hypothetical protein
MLWQLNNTFILQLDNVHVHFAHIVLGGLNVNFSGKWIGRAVPIAWTPRSPNLMPLGFFLWSYMKDKV